jgi:photosystem II stability/assembly factor-like uncharacterized protein
MRTILLFGLFLANFATILAQNDSLPQRLLSAMDARSIGPAAMSGRVTSIARDERDGNIYIGAASGGVWSSNDGGASWKPIFDDAPCQAIGSLAIRPENPDEIWVGTGEGNPRNSQNSGIGMFKSIDRGQTWQAVGLDKTRTLHRIVLPKGQSQTAIAGSLGSQWGPNAERGVFKTTDGGNSWRKVLYVNDSTGCADLVGDPRNPNKLVAAMWQYQRRPWGFKSGGAGSGLYMSFDGGESWVQRTEKHGLPKGTLGRIGLAVAPSNPDIIYAIIESEADQALYKSTDGGLHWGKMSTDKIMGGRPFYYSEIYVDPINENRIYSLHSIVSKSEDGGKSFQSFISYSAVHPDHHAFYIDPKDPDFLINGNDGGLAISRNRGKTWSYINNLPLGQFYHVGVDQQTPYNIYGGLQDNGSWVGPSSIWRSGSIRNADWQEVLFGDGFDVQPWQNNPRYGYAMYQGGELSFWDRETGFTQYIKPKHPDNTTLRFNWNAALAIDPFHECGVYYGSQFVHFSTDCGDSWRVISPDLTTNDTTKQQFQLSGGLTPDVTAAENHTTILCISPSPLDSNIIWVGTDDGNIQLTRDQGKTWVKVNASMPNLPKNAWIPQIHVSSVNKSEAFVVVNNYRNNDWQPYLYHTADFGKTWSRLADEKSVKGHCLSIVQDIDAPNLLFLGTEMGLYVSINKGKSWTQWKVGNFPSVPVIDMVIQQREADLVIGTFGRSFFVLDDIRPLRHLALAKEVNPSNSFKLLPSNRGILSEWRSVSGPRFPAANDFFGENKGTNIEINTWLGATLLADTVSIKADSANSKEIKYRIVNLMTGDTVRTLTAKLDSGLIRTSWYLDHKAPNYPRHNKPDEDRENGGWSVLPGKYRVVATFRNIKDSTDVEVMPDPRLTFSQLQMQQRFTTEMKFDSMVAATTKAFDQLKEAKNSLDRIEKGLELLPDSTQKDLKKQIGTLRDTINAMQSRVMQAEGGRGIQDDSWQLVYKLWGLSGYLASSMGPLEANGQLAYNQTETEAKAFISRVNAFFATEWEPFQQKVEQAKPPMFKLFEPVRW